MAISGISSANGVTALPQALLAVYSREIMHLALPAMRYEQFAVIKDELTRQPGTSITFTIYNNLGLGGQLTEGINMVPKNMTASQISIQVIEFGNAVAVTEYLLQSSYDDVLSEAAYELGRDYSRVVDLMLRNTVMTCTNVIWSGGVTSNGQTSAVISMNDVRRAVEIMYTANVPKIENDFYICFVHPHQATSLKRDPDWVSAQLYGQQAAIYRGEIGKFDDVRFIATGHQNNGAVASTDPAYDSSLVGTGAGGINLYRSVLFGDTFFGWAVGLPVEMRDNGVQDFGRQHALAWYSIMGSGILLNSNGVLLVTA
jgi:N4-gp56 family major capsid protein